MGLGPESRINMLRNILTGLVRHERIETTWARADEVRIYAEKLIDFAKRGDTDEKAMKMADFWLTEKDLVPNSSRCWYPVSRDRIATILVCSRSPTARTWTGPRWRCWSTRVTPTLL